MVTSLPDDTNPPGPSTGSSEDSAPTKERLQYEETGEEDGWEDEDWDVVIEDEQKVDHSKGSGYIQERNDEEEDVKLQTSPKVCDFVSFAELSPMYCTHTMFEDISCCIYAHTPIFHNLYLHSMPWGI